MLPGNALADPAGNITRFWHTLDLSQWDFGRHAYANYNVTLAAIGGVFGVPVTVAAGVFAALSPNNAYETNLRDVARAIHWHEWGKSVEDFRCTTYGDGRRKAWRILDGENPADVLPTGKKTWCFYHNVAFPLVSTEVTIDGHMIGVHLGHYTRMDDAKISHRVYAAIGRELTVIAATCALPHPTPVMPHMVQATIWHAWRQKHKVLSPAQGKLWTTEWEAVEIAHTIRFGSRCD